jgi:hypothetical protein
MPTPNAIRPPLGSIVRPPGRGLRDVHDPAELTPEGRRLARTAGGALAAVALLIAFAASAQTAAYGPQSEGSGALPWLFALFAAAAVLGVFLLVLTLGKRPGVRPPGHVPGASRNR